MKFTFGGRVAQLVAHQAGDRKVAGSMSFGKTLNANFLTVSVWCGRQQRCLFHRGIYRTKGKKKQTKNKRTWYYLYLRKWVWVTICPMLNVYDVVPRVKRINRTNQLRHYKFSFH